MTFPQTPAPDWLLMVQELKAARQWLNWRWEVTKDGRLTKVPYEAATGEKADTTDPRTWCDYATAKDAVLQGRFPGVGFVVTEHECLCGIDLDKCRDPETGVIAPWARREIARFNSYAEVTVSGTGIRIWVRGTKGDNERCKVTTGPLAGHIECYDRERFFTLSGQHIAGTPMLIEPRQAELDAFLAEHLPPRPQREPRPPREPRPLACSDAQIIEKALGASNGAAFAALW